MSICCLCVFVCSRVSAPNLLWREHQQMRVWSSLHTCSHGYKENVQHLPTWSARALLFTGHHSDTGVDLSLQYLELQSHVTSPPLLLRQPFVFPNSHTGSD